MITRETVFRYDFEKTELVLSENNSRGSIVRPKHERAQSRTTKLENSVVILMPLISHVQMCV